MALYVPLSNWVRVFDMVWKELKGREVNGFLGFKISIHISYLQLNLNLNFSIQLN